MKVLVLLLTFVHLYFLSFTQKAYPLHLQIAKEDTGAIIPFIDTEFYDGADSLRQVMKLEDLISRLRQEAYLEASLDSFFSQDSNWVAQLHVGRKYRWGRLDFSSIDRVYLAGSNPLLEKLGNDPVNQAELVLIMDNILDRASARGFPFATLKLADIRSNKDTLLASLSLETGRRLYIDTIEIKGDARISAGVLHRYLDLEKGSPFSRSTLLEVPRKMYELPYLIMQDKPELYFSGSEARLVLDLQRRNASKFDFLLGILPQREVGRSTIITGSFLADLVNQFALGERMYVEYERLRPQTQQLELKVDFPFVPAIPFGVEGSFGLHKQDTLYTELQWMAGLQYALSTRIQLRAFLQWESMRLIGIPKGLLLQQISLPANLDISSRGFGLSLNYQGLDYRFNPRSGISADLTTSAKSKRIIRNNEILELEREFPDYPADSLYNLLNLRSEDLSLELNAAFYIPIGRRATVKLANQSAMILSEEALFNNEVYRIGGVHTLRGFDEESIFADRYTVMTGEYRLLLDKNSFLSLFGDLCFYGNRTKEDTIQGEAYGFGAGLSFETKAGIFALSTALGSQNGSPIDFRAAKIHFGYINLF